MFESIFKYPASFYGKGKLVFLSGLPGEVRLLLTIGLIALAWYLYRKVSGRVAKRSHRALLGLRICVLIILMFVLGVPALRATSPTPSAVFTALMLDTSRSMSIEDVGSGDERQARIDAAREILVGHEEQGLLKELQRTSKVLLYAFDERATRVAEVTELKADGSRTSLFRSIRDVDTELRSVPLASVVLVTDGCRNLGGSAVEAARILEARRVPLHIIGLGDPNPPKDYEVVRVYAPRRIRRNTEIEIYATIRHTELHEPFELTITRGEIPLLSKEIQPRKGSDITSLRIAFTPDHEGTATYKLVIPPAEDEALTDNNSREFVIDIQDDRLPVLYIEGSPRLEYRFLRRALFRDRDFRLVGLLRLADDRFYIQGASKEERYLAEGFPDTRERLFAFQAVVLGDIEAQHFTGTQLGLIKDFVRERGGGMLMLGGVNSFGLGKYANTPVGEMLPVEVSPADPAYSDERFGAVATDDAMKHPVMRLSPVPDLNRRLWEKAPPLIGITPVRGVKAGASVLLVHEKDRRPVLAVQNYGQGRVAAFTSGGSWYWQVSMPASDEFHEKFWKQLVRWLAVGAKEQLTAEVDADVHARYEAVFVRATALGPDRRPVNDAVVIASVTDPFGNTEEIPMDWVLSEEGVYQCRYLPSEEGEYHVKVHVEGWRVKPAETGFMVGEPLIEFADAGLKESVLRKMAEMTGGRYFSCQDVSQIPAEVAKAVQTARYAGVRPHEREIWDSPFVFVLLLSIMGVEWFVRRRAGLA